MALNISGATIGFDENELQTTFNNLKAKCITETIEVMRSKTSEIFDFVDAAWVGNSATQFKQNWSNDITYVVQNLRAAEQQLYNQFRQIANTMNEQEAAIVTKREGGRIN